MRDGDKGHSITLAEIEAQRQGIELSGRGSAKYSALTEEMYNKLHIWMTEELDRNKPLPSLDEFGDQRGNYDDWVAKRRAEVDDINAKAVEYKDTNDSETIFSREFRNYDDSADALQYFQKINETMKTSPDPITVTEEQAEAIINGGVAICRGGASPKHTSAWKEFLDEARANCEPTEQDALGVDFISFDEAASIQGDSLNDQGVPFDSEPAQEGIEVAIHRASLLDDIQYFYDVIERHKQYIKETRQQITQLDNSKYG